MITEYIEMTITSMIMLVGFWKMSDILFEEKSRKDIKGILMIIGFSMIVAIFNINKVATAVGFAKIIISFILMVIFSKNKYRIGIMDAIIGSVILYANIIILDFFIEIIILIISKILNTSTEVIPLVRYSMGIAFTATIFSYSMLKILNQRYLKLFKKIQTQDSILTIVILIVFIIMTVISGIIPIKQLEIGIEMLVATLLIVGFFIIGIYIIIERIEKENIQRNYKQLSDYAKVNEGLLEDYRVTCHENRNHLIVIDNMIPKSNKKVHEYIKSILDNGEMNKYYFINELKNIPITELKGFINYKLMEMLNEGINLQIHISEQIITTIGIFVFIKEKEDLYNIVGILLDNAYEASRESKEKELVLEMHKEKSTIVIMVANTYRGKVEIDKISEYGYSSKGKNHGTGLYIVENIITKNQRFQKETSIMENYFIQTMKIK